MLPTTCWNAEKYKMRSCNRWTDSISQPRRLTRCGVVASFFSFLWHYGKNVENVLVKSLPCLNHRLESHGWKRLIGQGHFSWADEILLVLYIEFELEAKRGEQKKSIRVWIYIFDDSAIKERCTYYYGFIEGKGSMKTLNEVLRAVLRYLQTFDRKRTF